MRKFPVSHIHRAIRFYLGVIIAGLYVPVIAQVTILPRPITPTETGFVYNTESSMNFRLYPRGFSLGWYQGKIETYYRTKFYYGEIGMQRHHKEVRQSNELAAILGGDQTPRPYVYGKLNSYYTIKAGYGIKRYYSEKAKRKGLAVGISYQGGATLGMLKPYYLRLIKRIDNQSVLVTERYTAENADIYLDPFRIYGAGPVLSGISEMRFIPGLHGMLASHFAFGAFDEYIMALDAGIGLDVYPRRVPIMVQDNTAWFLQFFLNLHIGKRK